MNGLTMSLVDIAIAANALASVLLKRAAIYSLDWARSLPPTKTLLLRGAALFFYAVAFIVYAMVRKSLPVSKAYTLITIGAQSVLILAGAVFFEERYAPASWLGLAMVMVGLVLVVRCTVT